LLTSSTDPEFRRLAAIYERRLERVVVRHYRRNRRRRLERSLKALIVLRLLDVPYRSGCPISTGAEKNLLSSLSVHCGGAGLMAWTEGGAPVYVVETDRERFVDWIVGRTTAFLGRDDRDKVLSDALWATLFATPGRDVGQDLPPSGAQTSDGCRTRSLLLSGDAFAGREAVVVQRPGVGRWVLVFESPWETDRGRRVRQVMKALPDGIGPGRVWIWVPRQPLPREDEDITLHMATSRALREVTSGERADGTTCGWLLRALQRLYLGASAPALEAIVACYREGTVVTDRGTWRPLERAQPLVHLVGEFGAWASGGDARQQSIG